MSQAFYGREEIYSDLQAGQTMEYSLCQLGPVATHYPANLPKQGRSHLETAPHFSWAYDRLSRSMGDVARSVA